MSKQPPRVTKVYVIGEGLVTPLGDSPQGVLKAVRAGKSAIREYPGWPEPYMASLLERSVHEAPSFFDHIAFQAGQKALPAAGTDPAAPRTGLVLSTIKGNVEAIESEDVSLSVQAGRLAAALGIGTPPVVVSNACISGLAALVQGMRMIRSGAYDKVLVVGAEVQSRFIVSGFQSLKALSPSPCRPFDAARDGLNLGEAAAAVVLSKTAAEGSWELVEGCIRNDANHISGPSRTGEGSYKALRAVLNHCTPEELAFVNVHGTATRYNDEMEAIALTRAGLQDVPVNALKGCFGHTMGAAGVLETIVSMHACEEGVVLPTKGFRELGVSCPVQVCEKERSTQKCAFIKLLSGFGGINGALLVRKGGGR